jgi:hypothetical protein
MRETTAWTEIIAFCECPACGESTELGSGVSFGDKPDAEQCGRCGCKFLVWGPDTEPQRPSGTATKEKE